MALAVKPTETVSQRVILQGVSWATYEHLLADFEDRHAAYFTYDQGVLEIRVPTPKHEKPKQLLTLLIEMLTLELDIDTENLGSTTFKREDLERGFEPDSCFYIQRAAQIRGKDDIDLAVDPPPDLVIEVDITHPSLNKLPLFAAVGVTEVWRYNGTAVTIYTLAQDAYTESETSHVLPGVTSAVLSQFIAESRELRRPDWLRRVRGRRVKRHSDLSITQTAPHFPPSCKYGIRLTKPPWIWYLVSIQQVIASTAI